MASCWDGGSCRLLNVVALLVLALVGIMVGANGTTKAFAIVLLRLEKTNTIPKRRFLQRLSQHRFVVVVHCFRFEATMSSYFRDNDTARLLLLLLLLSADGDDDNGVSVWASSIDPLLLMD